MFPGGENFWGFGQFFGQYGGGEWFKFFDQAKGVEKFQGAGDEPLCRPVCVGAQQHAGSEYDELVKFEGFEALFQLAFHLGVKHIAGGFCAIGRYQYCAGYACCFGERGELKGDLVVDMPLLFFGTSCFERGAQTGEPYISIYERGHFFQSVEIGQDLFDPGTGYADRTTYENDEFRIVRVLHKNLYQVFSCGPGGSDDQCFHISAF